MVLYLWISFLKSYPPKVLLIELHATLLVFVAPWIDFDDYKAFEGVTNDFRLKKTYCILGAKS